MRKILFRAKAANRERYRSYRTKYKNGDWVYGLLTDAENCFGFAEMTNTSGVQGIEVDKNTIGQYTGFTDKNGKKIFEGDILLVKTTLDSPDEKTRNDEYTAYGVVVFNEGNFELEGRGLVLCTYWGVKSLYAATHFRKYEVVGNIYDNKLEDYYE